MRFPRRILGRNLVIPLAVMCLVAAALPAAGAGRSQPAVDVSHVAHVRESAGVYLVQMLEDPVVAYGGGQSGFAATRPQRGRHVNPNSANVSRYRQFLNGRHAGALAAAGAPSDSKFYDYNFSFNGFAATLTPGQVARLKQQPDVAAVTLDQRRRPETDNTPSFLGLTGPGGLWEQLGGQGSAGENVVIGVIDTGIWPEHPSFSDQTDLAHRTGNSGKRTLAYGPPPADWFGVCQSGELWSRDDCNNKLIGARYFLEGTTHHGIAPNDYASARDRDGHGTHTASTAGGNAGVDPSIFGRDLGVGTISGMAPRARIAAYKACFGEAGCFLSDLVAAIDTAVSDGVDVINYSIGSDTPVLTSPDEVSFLFAADAGVFVATSAGNAGPDPSTVGSPAAAPWVTAVGASTHSRVFAATVTLGDGTTYTGGSVGVGVGPARLVDAADAGNDTCVGGLNPAAVKGAIVLCLRDPHFPRLDHSAAVAAAGGVGMILYDPPQPSVTPTDNHVVPTVHVTPSDGAAIEAYVDQAGTNARATLSAGSAAPNPSAPSMAGFSSRGPNGATGDIIKPDVTAPGVQILAGNSPHPFLGAQGQLFQAIQGTSMSSPHVAGVGALLRDAHPDWTPAMIRSALMTTGSQAVTKEDRATPADPFDIGGGHIRPTPAADPGLVYDAGLDDYLAFLCGQSLINPAGATCKRVGVADASDLNLASISVDGLAGIQTITRRVTNVGATTATYSVSVDAPEGIDAVVNPPTVTVPAGETMSYAVTFTRTTAPFDAWRFGSLTWSDGAHSVRSPIAIRSVALAAPDEVSGSGASGSVDYDVRFGYSGDFNTSVHGLLPATVTHDTVVDDPANDIDTALDTGIGINEYTISIPAGTRHFRGATFDENTDGDDDLDLYLYNPDGELVASSGSPTATEAVDVENPAAGDWKLIVHGWQTDGPDAVYDLFTWILGDADAGNLQVAAPSSAALGGTGPITLTWSGLAPGRYLGIVSYDNGTDELGSTLASITS